MKLRKKNTVFINNFDYESLKIKAPIKNGKLPTRIIEYESLDSLMTWEKFMELTIVEGFLDLSENPELNYISVINRHQGMDTHFTGVVEKFHLDSGALAGTVSHDSHNLTVVYTNVEDAEIAIEEIKKMRGGIVYVNGGEITSVALPIAGLLTTQEPDEFIIKVNALKMVLREHGIEHTNPIMRLATSALPAAPILKITDKGLVNAMNQEFVSLFP